jgi:hypothetical protein
MTSTDTIRPDADNLAAEQPAPRPTMRVRTKLMICAGVVIATGGAVAALDLALKGDDADTKTFDTPISAVAVDMAGGSLTIIGSNEPTITVELTAKGGLRKANHSERIEDGRLIVKSTCPMGMLTPSCKTDYVLHVPEAVDVELAGDGITADVAGVTGAIDVSINGGDIDIEFDVAPPTVKARANGGDIDIVVPDDATEYHVETSSNGGSTDALVRTDPASSRTLDLHTNGGSISVSYPTEPRA